jgi:hypothetical protein
VPRIAAWALVALALAACAPEVTRVPVATVAPAPAATPAAGATLVWRGVALGLWDQLGEGDDAAYPLAAQLADIRALGADHVLYVVRWRQHDVHSATLAPDPAVTLPDARLVAAIRAAHAAGLAVLVFPIVDLEVIRQGEWRGTIVPPDVGAWWSSYRDFVLHYAAIAADEHAAALSLGSELGSTEAWRDRWYALASSVRARFPGALVYSANWDHFDRVSFWERVDAVGVSAYPPLADGSDAAREASWRGFAARLVAFARAQGKPLVLTEVGVPSVRGAAASPWDYTAQGDVDLDVQRRCFAAFARAFAGEPTLTGMFVWVWGAGGASDRGYAVRGKPAEAVLRAFYGRGARAESR